MKGTGYSVKNGICFVYFGVSVTTPSNSWVEVLSGLPKPLKASEFCISARADSDIRKSLIVYKDSGDVLNVAFGTANASYYDTISYPVA